MMPKRHASKKSKSGRGRSPYQRNDLCRSQSSHVNNSLTPVSVPGPTIYNTMDNCLPSTMDEYLKIDLYQTISSSNSDDVFRMIESSNVRDNYFDQTTLDQGLLMACDRGHKFVVQHLLLKGASINARDPLGYTPLLLAVEKGFIEIVRTLLNKGADVNVTNMRGDSALTLSVRTCGSKVMVSLLLSQKSVDVNHRNKDGYSCWMKAMEALDFDTLKLLIKSGKVINKDIDSFKVQTNKTASTASVTERLDTQTFNVHAIVSLLEREANGSQNSLRLAVFERDLNCVRYLMDYGIFDDQLYNDGRLLIEFMENIESNSNKQCHLNETELEIIRKLLTVAAKFYLKSSFRADEVLVVAVKIGSSELVELLCQHVAISNTYTMTSQYSRAINAVAEKGRCDLLNVLIKYANTYNCFDRIPLKSAIVTALKSGNVNVVKILIKNGVTVNVESGLNIAVKHKRLHSLRFLISKFSYVCRSAIHNKCEGLFHEAVELGDVDIINALLDLGSDVNLLYGGRLPLMNAGTPEVMELLIRRGAEVKQAENRNKINLLSNIILRELKKNRAKVQTCEQEEKAEQSSSDVKFKEMVEILLRNGASVNDTDSSGQTPLMAVAQQSDGGNVLRVLLEAGAEVNRADCNGVTVLQDAVNFRCLKNIEILIEAGADVNKKDKDGRTVLHRTKRTKTAAQCSTEQKGQRRPHSAPPNKKDKDGRTVLHQTIHNEEILKCLLHHGADVDAEDARGNTALLLVVISYRRYNEISFGVLRNLLEAGSDVNHQNATGETALMKAALNRNDAAIKLLCEAKADVKLRTRDNTHDVISFPVDKLYLERRTSGDVFESLFYLFDRGASSSCVSHQNLYYFILKGCSTIVQRLVESGLIPSDIVTNHLEVNYTDPLCTKKISPFCFALLCNQVTLARYFSDIWYLTYSDVSTLTQDKDVRRHLTSQRHKESLIFLEEFSSQPISLQTLSFVAVSTSIGTGPDRELRVRGLLLPNMFKDKLMFSISSGCGERLQFEDEQK